LWDQSAFKQSIVDGYDPVMRWGRPFYNAAARILRRPTLPRPGQALRSAYGSFFCVRDNDPELARLLIAQLLSRAHSGIRVTDHLLLGFAESDPLLAVARGFPHVAYPSGIYTVAWDDDSDTGTHFHDGLDTRPRYLELGSL
jgi:hypothetical protein